MLAVQDMTGCAVAALEQQLRPLITRKASENSPRFSPRLSPTSPSLLTDARGARRISLSSPLSTFSSPGEFANSPESPAPQAWSDEQQPRWVAAAAEGSITAPLVAAALLLMERAWSRRQSLIGSVQSLRGRAVALAVGEASAAAGSLAAAGGDGLHTAAVAVADSVPIVGKVSGRSPLSTPPSSPSPFSVAERQRLSVPAGVARVSTSQGGTTTTPPPANTGALANLSCCVDFERILGEEDDALPQEEVSPLLGNERGAAVGSSVLQARGSSDKGKPLSDSSMIAERSFSGMDQHSGSGEVLHFMGGVEASTIRSSIDTWPAVFEDVAIAEERGREAVGIWEAAGGALGDACEELAFEEAGHSMFRGLAAQ